METIKYTTSTVVNRRASDDPPVTVSITEAKELIRAHFENDPEVVDNKPDIITIEQKKMDGVESDLNIGEGLQSIQLEKGAVYRRYVFTPVPGVEGADNDMNELNKLVRQSRRAS